MPTVLLTGFRAFADEPRNPAAEIAGELGGTTLGGCRIESAILPVSRGQVLARVETPLVRHRPEAVLALGLARERSVVTVEERAVNLEDYEIADELGEQPRGEPVVEGGPDSLPATLPVEKMVEAIRGAGIPARPSGDAGRYVCNRLFYALLHRALAAGEAGPRVGFVHLPPLPESVALLDNERPSMALETSRRAVEAALTAVAAALTGDGPAG
jgi:pyroglutamyl-peptidase